MLHRYRVVLDWITAITNDDAGVAHAAVTGPLPPRADNNNIRSSGQMVTNKFGDPNSDVS